MNYVDKDGRFTKEYRLFLLETAYQIVKTVQDNCSLDGYQEVKVLNEVLGASSALSDSIDYMRDL